MLNLYIIYNWTPPSFLFQSQSNAGKYESCYPCVLGSLSHVSNGHTGLNRTNCVLLYIVVCQFVLHLVDLDKKYSHLYFKIVGEGGACPHG